MIALDATVAASSEPMMRSTLARVADALGWTQGQVWTVALGLALAIPAAVFGLGPALQEVGEEIAPFAAPVAAAPPTTGDTPAATESVDLPPPADLALPPRLGLPGPETASPPSSQSSDAASSPPATLDGSFATVAGPGVVRALAVAADGVAVAVDVGAAAPARLVVLDGEGRPALDLTLEVEGAPYREAGGVAVVDGGVLVTTASPAAVLRVDPRARTVTVVADLPDVPLCLPVAAATECQQVVPDGAAHPEHLAVTGAGDIFVADRGQGCIFHVVPGGQRASAWLCDLAFEASPTESAGGLMGLAVTEDRLVLTITTGLDGSDRVEEVAIVGRAPGARRQLGTVATGAGARGAALLPDGRVLVALANARAVLVVEADGVSTRTVALTDLAGPTDLEVSGGSLLVAHLVDGSAGGVHRQPLGTL